MRRSITITGVFLLAVAALLNIQQSSLAFAAEDEDNNLLHVRKQNTTTDIFELVSGIFAAILCVSSLGVYTKPKIKGRSLFWPRLKYMPCVPLQLRLEIYTSEEESPVLESVLSILFLMALALFFVAIVQRERIKPSIHNQIR